MATTTGSRYDHIAISDGSDIILHYLTDNRYPDVPNDSTKVLKGDGTWGTIGANAVIVSPTQPTAEDNKIWIDPDTVTETEVPTMDEFNELNNAINDKYTKPSGGIPASDLASGAIPDVPVQDVQVNGVSVLTDGVANVPMANSSTGAPGVIGVVDYERGLAVNNGCLGVVTANASIIKAGTNTFRTLVPARQHESTFYGLAKAAGVDMASSSNAVGKYTDEAKIAIQKMLGIYQAPWELIREDTVTNATEADINITVDGNGQAFELTDVLVVLIVPTHSEDTTIGDYGRIYLYNNTTEIRRLYLINAASKLVQANSTAQIAIGRLLNDNGMMSIDIYPWTTQSNRATLQIVPNSELNGTNTPFAINTNYISKIKIGGITGMMQYRLYGKRKWQ